MNKKKLLIIIVSSFVMLLAAILIYSNIDSNDIGINSMGAEKELIEVDKIVENPEKFAGIVSVKGKVTEIIDNKKIFTLGCEDACIVLPVAYKGEMPKLESNIVALGEVKKDVDGKFFFDAREIKYR